MSIYIYITNAYTHNNICTHTPQNTNTHIKISSSAPGEELGDHGVVVHADLYCMSGVVEEGGRRRGKGKNGWLGLRRETQTTVCCVCVCVCACVLLYFLFVFLFTSSPSTTPVSTRTRPSTGRGVRSRVRVPVAGRKPEGRREWGGGAGGVGSFLFFSNTYILPITCPCLAHPPAPMTNLVTNYPTHPWPGFLRRRAPPPRGPSL